MAIRESALHAILLVDVPGIPNRDAYPISEQMYSEQRTSV